jgi:hypothetical protein
MTNENHTLEKWCNCDTMPIAIVLWKDENSTMWNCTMMGCWLDCLGFAILMITVCSWTNAHDLKLFIISRRGISNVVLEMIDFDRVYRDGSHMDLDNKNRSGRRMTQAWVRSRNKVFVCSDVQDVDCCLFRSGEWRFMLSHVFAARSQLWVHAF